ncbi:helix-turn-helix protein [Nocardia tenerifensis]|uniref:Helix-turn-helix protein n=1 Tax=Nocardia tenerifensis TaxID=228006 RepID=A0A318K0E2_9NOCA|nr:helix-turn-helix domain-containing protein [Nocardia tenerifensis]PXX60235.1 helix-turn-helix protein [Nocardia tenerifensis]
MKSGVADHGDALLWDIASPRRPSRVPGVSMAGFGDRGITPPDLRLIPHPAVTLVLVFDGSIALRDPTGRQHRGSFAMGPGFGEVVRALRVDAFDCLQVRLSPTVAHTVLGPAAADLDNSVVLLDDLLGRETSRLCEQLNALPSWDDRFAWTDAWLAGRCATAARVHPEVAWAWQRMVADRGMGRIEQLAAELGWSRKRLWSRFQSQVGLSPKRAAKLIRFDHAVHDLVAGLSPAAVAADCGYTDQSHLHRDVMTYTGLTPATVINEPFLAVDDVAWGWPRSRAK